MSTAVSPSVAGGPPLAAPDDASCPSCGAARPDRYCPACGEARVDPAELSLWGFAVHAFETFTNVDGALWRTLRTLVRHPGRLTADWLVGRRRGYVKPLQLFVLSNVALFLLLGGGIGRGRVFDYRAQDYLSRRVGSYAFRDTTALRARLATNAARAGLPVAGYVARLDAAMHAQRSVWFVFAPVFAGVLALAYARRRLPFGQHLVFAIHFFAFFLLYLGLFFLAVALLGEAVGGWAAWYRRTHGGAPPPGRDAINWAFRESTYAWVALAGLGAYLLRALREVYPERLGPALVRTLALVALLPMCFNVYRDLLLAVALWTA
jgi:hypothetical protein